MRVVARLSRGAAATRGANAGPAQATTHYNKMNNPKDSQYFKTKEEALAFVEECTFDFNTGQMMLEAAALHGVNVDAVLDKLDVTGFPKKSGYVIRQAFRTAINDAAMNPLRQAAAQITFVSYTPAGTPKPPVKKPVTCRGCSSRARPRRSRWSTTPRVMMMMTSIMTRPRKARTTTT